MSSSNARSRKSSITSRRAPASLRIPSATRRGSSTQLSFVFAEGDSIARTGQIEDQLSKQLDGDTGGKQMGLRSRRSSSATVRTVRTTSGLRSPDPDTASVMEEDENQGESSHLQRVTSPEPLAGPSSLNTNGDRIGQSRDTSPAPTLGGKRTLNPKQSSSWLRWNSTTPSFPRSPSLAKGKGKEKERDNQVVQDIHDQTGSSLKPPDNTTSIPPVSSYPAQPSSKDDLTPTPTIESAPQPFSEASINAQNAPSISSTSKTPVPPPAKSRGWFSRSNPVQPPPPPLAPPSKPIQAAGAEAHEPSEPPETRGTDFPSLAVTQAEITLKSNTASQQHGTSTSSAPQSAIAAPFIGDPDNYPATSKPSNSQENARKVGGGWSGYLGWGNDKKTNVKMDVPGSTNNGEQRTEEQSQSEQPILGLGPQLHESHQENNSVSTSVPNAGSPPTLAAHGPPSQTDGQSLSPLSGELPPTAVPQPWSSYLYSFVVPPPRAIPASSTQSTRSEPVEPSSPTEDQQAAHTEPPMPDVNIREATPVPNEPEMASEPGLIPSAGTSPARPADRRPSNTGWLNYLAFRASQKKIAPSSMQTAEIDQEHPGDNEEVMDFSADPNFPSAPIQNLAPPHAMRGRDVKVAPESIKSVTPKPSQTLNARKKRLSNASLISNGSHTPLPPSPKGRSSQDSARPGSVHKDNGSALPPPPQAPALQPNLVIPSFADTFDRPPRSFLPTPQSENQPEPSTKGITAATTGLAWKALGAVGSYVYGGTETAKAVTPETLQENEKETRGRKEGRSVGADLPRRVGLGNGTPDDGWKQVKRVVVVGVHGWFPAKMLNSVIGEPTGTSTKFANMMGQAVQQFFHEKGVDDIRLTLMPLEGEGTIESRVDRLYKAYLSNPAWINDLRRADAIFFAAHSQGCIVTTHLISRMIAQGHIRTPLNQESKVAMLAMCGVHLGPLYSISTSTVIQPYLQWFENAAARELFEFQDSTSAVSIAYQKALSMVLENEVKVVLLASLNDQVVPIYGASFSTATHPLLLRALYVDGASYTQSDFMTNLLCFAFMLRNAGIDDQRLVEHLSEATAGSLTGVGHSTPYEELSCYSVAVQYLFHSGPARHPVPPLEIEPFSARDAKNDFELPWIMRALVDSSEVKDLFPSELRDLKEGILHWRPNTKVLKEIKRRLEPMAGRQSRLRALHTSPSSASLSSNNNEGLGVSPGANKALATTSGKALKSRL
uniref:YMC020W-like alpha/beta hydrolase domain-containing protein n=1 Tax=Kwoniella dejecticola CBS 10117 TaxID=1296121 RepID=A0A1A5ZWN7_9TREE|nr:uncharacterized protein I303_06980 [Kwoniella dejecticola CBS 10117]OBR82221.1 hypothetical protein I303_06980 [Kwoniella dejecticola CBS 10117]